MLRALSVFPGGWSLEAAEEVCSGDGVEKDDVQQNSRVGVTFSLPLASGWSTKLSWSKGVATRIAGDFEVIGVTLQYRWFDQ